MSVYRRSEDNFIEVSMFFFIPFNEIGEHLGTHHEGNKTKSFPNCVVNFAFIMKRLSEIQIEDLYIIVSGVMKD